MPTKYVAGLAMVGFEVVEEEASCSSGFTRGESRTGFGEDLVSSSTAAEFSFVVDVGAVDAGAAAGGEDDDDGVEDV